MDALNANDLIAKDVLNERLDVDLSPDNIADLSLALTEIERKDALRKNQGSRFERQIRC